jgi:hypothetical protein
VRESARLEIKVEKVFDKPKPKGMLLAFAINKLDEEIFKELAEREARLSA